MNEKGNEKTAQGIFYLYIQFPVIYSVYSCRGFEIFMTVECKDIILSIFEISNLYVNIYLKTNLDCLNNPTNDFIVFKLYLPDFTFSGTLKYTCSIS